MITRGQMNELAHALLTEYTRCRKGFMADGMGQDSTKLHYRKSC